MLSSHSHSNTPQTHHLQNPNQPSLTSMKIKTLIHNLLISYICRLVRSASKLKALILHLCRETRVLYLQDSEIKKRKRKSRDRKKILFGSFRLHYNWCSSSHVIPINFSTSPSMDEASSTSSHLYYDSTWNSLFSTHDGNEDKVDVKDWSSSIKEGEGFCGFDGANQLSSYLEWLEKKGNGNGNGKGKGNGNGNEEELNEIDKLADMFIASCHEKFRLEKIESYRRYQEMLARSA